MGRGVREFMWKSVSFCRPLETRTIWNQGTGNPTPDITTTKGLNPESLETPYAPKLTLNSISIYSRSRHLPPSKEKTHLLLAEGRRDFGLEVGLQGFSASGLECALHNRPDHTACTLDSQSSMALLCLASRVATTATAWDVRIQHGSPRSPQTLTIPNPTP